MSLPEDTKREINEYLFEQEKLRKELIDDAKREIINSLNDPERELRENEKRLIKNTTKKYNIIILIITGITAISIGFIANTYTSFLENKSEKDFIEKVREFEKEIDQLEDNFEDEIDEHLKNTREDIDKIIERYNRSSEELSEKRGEYEVLNKDFENKQDKVRELMAQLDSGIVKATDRHEKLEQLDDNFQELLSNAVMRTNQLESYVNENKRLIDILEKSNELFVVKNEKGQFSFTIGELYVEWGTGILNKSGTTEISFINPFSNKEDIGISIMGEELKSNSFAQIKELDESGFQFKIINPEIKSDYIQKTGRYRYIAIGTR